jgi:hypothetical protein
LQTDWPTVDDAQTSKLSRPSCRGEERRRERSSVNITESRVDPFDDFIRPECAGTYRDAAAVLLNVAVGEGDGTDTDEATDGRSGTGAGEVGKNGRRDGRANGGGRDDHGEEGEAKHVEIWWEREGLNE